MYIENNDKFENNIFYNIGFVKGKLEILSDINIPRTKDEMLKIVEEISSKIDLIYIQAKKITENIK